MKSAASNEPSPRPRILVIDDSGYGATARRVVLQELGYDVVTADSVRSGIECLGHAHCDMVVANHRGPELDATGLVPYMREHHPAVPVVLISGVADTLGLDELSTGADLVIQKGAHEVNQLVRAANRWLRRKTTRKPPYSVPPPPVRVRRRGV